MEGNEQLLHKKEAATALEVLDQAGYEVQPEDLDVWIEWEAESVWPDDQFICSDER